MILDIRNLAFRYNGRDILRDIDLEVQPGELLAILGPNGVGKTTLLKCFNRIHCPQEGTVLVEERSILSLRPDEIARTIGYVAQRSESARITVFDAVLMGRRPHLRWGVREKDLITVNAALGHLDLESLALRYIDELSGGELQKVAIARALVQEPRLLLFDEPTSALDLKNQEAILTIIRKIVDEHRVGAVMTMHDLNSALRYADRYCFLKKGGVYAAGSCGSITPAMIEEVYGLPVSIHHIDGCPVVLPASSATTNIP